MFEKGENPEECERTASLFSEKFRDYLLSKKTSLSNEDKIQKPSSRKDHSPSSSETTASESSKLSGRKTVKKIKKKKPLWNLACPFRHRLTQCSLLTPGECAAPAEELKPLLLNMTILLQDLKQSPSEHEKLYNLISKIIILVTEFIRRPLKKIQESNGEYWKKAEKTIEMMMTLVQTHKTGMNLDSSNTVREYKRIEKEIANKNNAIADLKKNLAKTVQKTDSKSKDLELRVRSSILANEKLKSEIKFNHRLVKKYKKILLEKEWAKHKLENEVSHLKKKFSKVDLSDCESLDKQQLDLNVTPELNLPNENQNLSQGVKNKTIKTKKKTIHFVFN